MKTTIEVSGARPAIENMARLQFDNIERLGVYTRLYFEGQNYTNLDELRQAGSLARVLRSHHVSPGDRVVVMMPNSPELAAAFQAIWMIGATVVPVIPQWTAGEIAYILSSAQPSVALTVPPLAPRIYDADSGIRSLRQLCVWGPSDVAGVDNIAAEIASTPPIDTPADCAPSDLALLLYTSGTTGPPKGVMLTHANVASAVDSACRQHPGLERGAMLHALPFTHVYGLLALNAANVWGCSTVLMRQFEPTRALEAIAHYRVKYLPAVPTMLVYLLNHPERARYDLSSLTWIVSGGAALPERLRQQTEQILNCRVDQGYGLSESASGATGYETGRPYRPGSAGVAQPGVEIRIADDRDQPLPVGTAGEICLRGPNIMSGYWRDPEATNETLKNGWLHSGDIGYLDEDGYLFITDRKKDLIIKGGENISPREIEEVLYGHPAVAEAAVVGIPDPVFGEEICAVLQLKSGVEVTEQDLRIHVARYVTKFKVPSRVVFQSMLPKNLNGKILKYKIRAQLLSAIPG